MAFSFSHPCFPDFRLSLCSFIYSTNINLVPVVCQTHHKYSGCHREQDKGPASGPSVPSASSSFSFLFCLLSVFFSISCFITWPTAGVLLTFILHHPSPLCHSALCPSPASRRKLQFLGMTSGALNIWL